MKISAAKLRFSLGVSPQEYFPFPIPFGHGNAVAQYASASSLFFAQNFHLLLGRANVNTT